MREVNNVIESCIKLEDLGNESFRDLAEASPRAYADRMWQVVIPYQDKQFGGFDKFQCKFRR